MRIGIDCRTIFSNSGQRTGVGNYIYHLTAEMLQIDRDDQFMLYVRSKADHEPRFNHQHVTVRSFRLNEYKKYLPFVYSHMLLASMIGKDNVDVFHAPANSIPLAYNKTSVVTVHDLAIYKFPEMFPAGQGFSTKRVVPKSLAKASALIAVSESTKRDLIELFRLPEEKIHVIHHGVDHDRFKPVTDAKILDDIRRKYNIKNKYILFVGTLEPRKNITRLIEAYQYLEHANPTIHDEYQLVIAGGKGWLYDEIFELVRDRGISKEVVFTDYVPEVDLPALISGADLFVFPSLYEGFGLPVLEAMACGTPVLTSNSSSLPEVAGDAAAYVDPYDVQGMSKAIFLLINDWAHRRALSKAGIEQAQKFTWAEAARKTIDVYRSVGKK